MSFLKGPLSMGRGDLAPTPCGPLLSCQKVLPPAFLPTVLMMVTASTRPLLLASLSIHQTCDPAPEAPQCQARLIRIGTARATGTSSSLQSTVKWHDSA